jgi:hypothetical protein
MKIPLEAARNPQKKNTVIMATKGELPERFMIKIYSKVLV